MEIRQLSLADEAPLVKLPDVDYFSENYAWHGYDYETRTGFYAHIGRWSEDRRMLREQMYVYLPDGTTLSYRSVGLGDCSRGPAAGVQKQVCVTPGKHWVIMHNGPTWHHRLDELVGGPMTETIPKRLNLHIEFFADTPVFLYDDSNNVTWGKWHYEQMGRVNGTIEFDGHTYPVSGMGFRDHSRGPRKLTHFIGNNWIQGRLPDGTGFALFEVWHEENGLITKPLSKATLLRPDGIVSAKLLSTPGLSSLDDVLAPIEVSFEGPDRRYDLTGEILNTVIYGVSDEHNTLTGAPRGRTPFVATEQPVRFMLNGQPVDGHCERCRPMTLTSPALRIR